MLSFQYFTHWREEYNKEIYFHIIIMKMKIYDVVHQMERNGEREVLMNPNCK